MRNIYTAFWMSLAVPAGACDLSLLLAVDVSGSVDRNEYAIQMTGLSKALQSGIIADALVQQEAYLSLMQWTGTSRQRVTIPWQQMRSHADVAAFARSVSEDPRIWRNYSTAIGEALTAAMGAFDTVPDCVRRVVDVSGDGVSNEGAAPEAIKAILANAGLTINALAIETDATDLTAYFYENLIAGEGAFVLTADGFEDYPEKILRKLQREVLNRLSSMHDE